jgi:TPR repeat protein
MCAKVTLAGLGVWLVLSGTAQGAECQTPAECVQLAEKYLSGRAQIRRDYKKALALLRHICEPAAARDKKPLAEDEARACTLLGEMYTAGQAGKPDRKRGAILYKRACDAGNARACAAYSRALYYDEGDAGQDVVEVVGKAITLHRKACEGGSPADCHAAGALYEEGPGQRGADAAAIPLYEKACSGDSAEGCYRLGRALAHKRGDVTGGIARLRKACDAGIAQACIEAGELVGRGAGKVAADQAGASALYGQAVAAYERECDAGLAEACLAVGEMYATGNGVSRSARTALGYYKTACDAQDVAGCRKLGELYQLGEGGIEKNEQEALHIYRKACDRFDAESCEHVSIWYGSSNHKEAARYHTRACELDKNACQVVEKTTP